MLGKMLIQGAVAAILIGSFAAVYAQAKDNGTQSPDARAEVRAAAPAEAARDDGYLRPTEVRTRRDDDRDRRLSRERREDRHHDRRRDHDDDDD